MEHLTITQIIVGLATLGVALGVGIILPPIFLRIVLKDWVTWRERVEKKLDRLQPEHVIKIEGLDVDRLLRHYQKLHDIGNMVTAHELRTTANAKRLDDHEERIRGLEMANRGERK